jgi:hypothetical protein
VHRRGPFLFLFADDDDSAHQLGEQLREQAPGNARLFYMEGTAGLVPLRRNTAKAGARTRSAGDAARREEPAVRPRSRICCRERSMASRDNCFRRLPAASTHQRRRLKSPVRNENGCGCVEELLCCGCETARG